MEPLPPLFLLLALTSILAVTLGGTVKQIECLAKLDGKKDNPNNLYTCNDPETCCQENGRPTCCKEKSGSDSALDQAKLWGSLAVLILVLAGLMWYCRHDGDCCGKKKGISCPCRGQKGDIEG